MKLPYIEAPIDFNHIKIKSVLIFFILKENSRKIV